MADEVYQENIWKEGAKFVSCRKVAYDLDLCKYVYLKDMIRIISG
jgi:hypothetical protein